MRNNPMKRITVLALLLCAMCAAAQEKSVLPLWHNELRIGWGDQLFETLMWHNPTSVVTAMPESFTKTYHEDYRYSQHLWMEYQYYSAVWFSAGAMVDLSEVSWNDVTRNGKGVETVRSTRRYFYNAVAMPTIRFTYFNHPNVRIYCGLGAGIGINGGTEMNANHHKTDVGLAVQLTLLGVSANYGRWFIAADLGGLTSLRDKNTVFMAMSRIVSASAGVRF